MKSFGFAFVLLCILSAQLANSAPQDKATTEAGVIDTPSVKPSLIETSAPPKDNEKVPEQTDSTSNAPKAAAEDSKPTEVSDKDETTTSAPPPDTTSSTPDTTSSSSTTTTTSPLTTSSSSSTTTTTTTTPAPAPTPSPIPSTTTTVKPTPVPDHDRSQFSLTAFIGGMVFAFGMMAIGFIAFKFYKARNERNYHTL